MDDGLSGADRWYEYHKNTSARLQELVAIIEDPTVPEGSQIKLRNDKAFSNEDMKMLDDMAKLLGGGLG